MGFFHQLIERIGHKAMMVNRAPRTDIPHNHTCAAECGEYGLRHGLVLTARVVQVQEAHLSPVEGQQQSHN